MSLALPLIVTQLGMVLYGTTDILFVGRLGAQAIAAVGLASVTYFTFFIFGMGTLMGMESLTSKAFGAGKPDVCAQLLVHALALAFLLALPLFLLLGAVGPVYARIGVDPATLEKTMAYLRISRLALFPALAFVACRQFLQSMNITRPLLLAIFLGNAANAVLDYTLIFGHLGAPPLGVEGSALATLTANCVMLTVVAAAVLLELRAIRAAFHGWRWPLLGEMAALGLPGGAQMLVEMLVFTLVTALIGRLGPQALAANQITLNIVSITFMIPMGLSHAASVRVGQALGRGKPQEAVTAGDTAVMLAMSFMGTMAMLIAAAPGMIMSLFTSDLEVRRLGVSLLYTAAVFQVFDGMQAVLTGALRGSGNTRSAMEANLIGHWALGLPAGCFLAFGLGFGATGLWSGLCLGIAATAMALRASWRRRALMLCA